MSDFKIYSINRDVIYPKDADDSDVDIELVDKFIDAGFTDFYADPTEGIVAVRVSGIHLAGAGDSPEDRIAIYRAEENLDPGELLANLVSNVERAFASEELLDPAELGDSPSTTSKVSIKPNNPRQDSISPSIVCSLLGGDPTEDKDTQTEKEPADFIGETSDTSRGGGYTGSGRKESDGIIRDLRDTVQEISAGKSGLRVAAQTYQQALRMGRAAALAGASVIVGGTEPENHFKDATVIIKHREQSTSGPISRRSQRLWQRTQEDILESKVDAAVDPIEEKVESIKSGQADPDGLEADPSKSVSRVRMLTTVAQQTIKNWHYVTKPNTRYENLRGLAEHERPQAVQELISLIKENLHEVPEDAQRRYKKEVKRVIDEALANLEEAVVEDANTDISQTVDNYGPALQVTSKLSETDARIWLLKEALNRNGSTIDGLKFRARSVVRTGKRGLRATGGISPTFQRGGGRWRIGIVVIGLLLAIAGLIVKFGTILDPVYRGLLRVVQSYSTFIILGGFAVLFLWIVVRYGGGGQPTAGGGMSNIPIRKPTLGTLSIFIGGLSLVLLIGVIAVLIAMQVGPAWWFCGVPVIGNPNVCEPVITKDPGSQTVTISGDTPSQSVKIYVNNSNGELVRTKTVSVKNGDYSYTVADLSPGKYTVHVIESESVNLTDSFRVPASWGTATPTSTPPSPTPTPPPTTQQTTQQSKAALGTIINTTVYNDNGTLGNLSTASTRFNSLNVTVRLNRTNIGNLNNTTVTVELGPIERVQTKEKINRTIVTFVFTDLEQDVQTVTLRVNDTVVDTVRATGTANTHAAPRHHFTTG